MLLLLNHDASQYEHALYMHMYVLSGAELTQAVTIKIDRKIMGTRCRDCCDVILAHFKFATFKSSLTRFKSGSSRLQRNRYAIMTAFHDFRINNLEDKLIFVGIVHFLRFRFCSKSTWILKEIQTNLAQKILEDFVICEKRS